MKNKHLVMYESNPTGIKSLQKLIDEGVAITFLTVDKGWYIAGIPEVALLFEQIDIIEDPNMFDYDFALETVRTLNKRKRIDGIISFSEFHIVHVAKIANEMDLPGVSIDAVEKSRNKDLHRIALAEAGLPQPEFFVAKSEIEVRDCVNRMGFPCIMKIADGTAGQYVACVHNPDEVDQFIAEAANEDVTRGRGITRRMTYLVESFEKGEVVSVESIVSSDGTINLLGVHDRIMEGYPRFIEMGFEYASSHDQWDILSELNERTIKALGINFGFVHIEFIVTESGPVVLEVNCRLAGCFLPELMTISSGIDPQVEAVRQNLGGVPRLSMAGDDIVLGRYFGVANTGVLRNVDLTNAQSSPGVVYAVNNVKPGKSVRPVEKFNYDVIGYVIVRSSGRSEAKELVKDAISKITISLDVQAVI